MSKLVRLAAALLPMALSLASLPARADTLSTFDFAGACSDCAGIGAGELVLNNYAIGSSITSNNFVSFTYNGTNLLPAFTITSGQEFAIDGSINAPLPAPEDFSIFALNGVFISSSDGFWCVGGGCIADFGVTHAWSIPAASTDVPEPMTIAILGGGLVGLAVSRRHFTIG